MISSAEARLERVAGALEERGFRVVIAASAEEAKDLILDLLPAGAEVRVARSVTMDQLGVTVAIEKSGRYKTIGRDLMMAHAATLPQEKARLGAAPAYILGSAKAITEDGLLLAASGTGSELGPYAYSAGHVVLAVGHQKIVRDLDQGLRRVREYRLPRGGTRTTGLGYPGSGVAKILLLEADPESRISVVLMPEELGS